MAPLTTEQRESVWARYMSDASNRQETFGAFLKPDLLVAVGEADDWIDAGSKGQMKNSMSAPCKSELTNQQKTNLENLTIDKRQGEF